MKAMEIVIVGGIFAVISLFLFLLIHKNYKKKLSEKDEQIISMEESLDELQTKVKEMEKRRGFRVKLTDTECSFTLIDSNDKNLEPLKNKKGKGWVRDISWTGIKMACQYDLPIRKGIILQIEFAIKDEEFTVLGKIVRKEDLINEFHYGIEFIDMKVSEQQKLYQVLQYLVIEQEKKTN
ncbi:conserved hypothetical protein [[Clostridium] ultunense Esp]|nr:conserved hypothetical protein [[Clostridium] ultunense Esp]